MSEIVLFWSGGEDIKWGATDHMYLHCTKWFSYILSRLLMGPSKTVTKIRKKYDTGRAPLIRSHLSARFSYKLSGNSN